MRILGVLAVTLALVSCATDPDAEARDRAHDEAEQIAESLELPPGYEVVEIKIQGAQTPKQNRGGGQDGHFTVYFEPEIRFSPAQVLTDFDTWFVGREMVRADWTGTPKCTETEARMAWADTEKVVVLQYWADGPYLVIPYSYSGMVTADTGALDTGVPVPTCP